MKIKIILYIFISTFLSITITAFPQDAPPPGSCASTIYHFGKACRPPEKSEEYRLVQGIVEMALDHRLELKLFRKEFRGEVLYSLTANKICLDDPFQQEDLGINFLNIARLCLDEELWNSRKKTDEDGNCYLFLSEPEDIEQFFLESISHARFRFVSFHHFFRPQVFVPRKEQKVDTMCMRFTGTLTSNDIMEIILRAQPHYTVAHPLVRLDHLSIDSGGKFQVIIDSGRECELRKIEVNFRILGQGRFSPFIPIHTKILQFRVNLPFDGVCLCLSFFIDPIYQPKLKMGYKANNPIELLSEMNIVYVDITRELNRWPLVMQERIDGHKTAGKIAKPNIETLFRVFDIFGGKIMRNDVYPGLRFEMLPYCDAGKTEQFRLKITEDTEFNPRVQQRIALCLQFSFAPDTPNRLYDSAENLDDPIEALACTNVVKACRFYSLVNPGFINHAKEFDIPKPATADCLREIVLAKEKVRGTGRSMDYTGTGRLMRKYGLKNTVKDE